MAETFCVGYGQKEKHAHFSRCRSHVTLESQVESSMEETVQFTIKQVASYVRSLTGDKFVEQSKCARLLDSKADKEKWVYASSCSRKEDITSVLRYRSGKLRAESTFPHLNIRQCRVWNVNETGLLVSHGMKYCYCKKGTVSPEATSNIKSEHGFVQVVKPQVARNNDYSFHRAHGREHPRYLGGLVTESSSAASRRIKNLFKTLCEIPIDETILLETLFLMAKARDTGHMFYKDTMKNTKM